jgi:type 1 glutamine amidotransferase
MARILAFVLLLVTTSCFSQSDRLVYKGQSGPGKGKNIVLISGDEEYRSEEFLPLMGKILATKHGFNTTVLFSTDPQTGIVNPENQTHISGLETLQNADLVIIAMRFRELPDKDMKFFDEYLKSGKPLIALRTSTHAFAYNRNKTGPYAHYSWNAKDGKWIGGFGKQVLGETWVAHHGDHGKEGTRALVNGLASKHSVLQGVNDIWGETDVYTINQLPDNAEVLLWGQVTAGMTPETPMTYEKSIMPLAWTREYVHENGKKSKIFASTLGTALEFTREDMRRLVVNASYWALGLEAQITPTLNVEIPGTYKPTMFGFGKHQKNKKPADFEVK